MKLRRDKAPDNERKRPVKLPRTRLYSYSGTSPKLSTTSAGEVARSSSDRDNHQSLPIKRKLMALLILAAGLAVVSYSSTIKTSPKITIKGNPEVSLRSEAEYQKSAQAFIGSSLLNRFKGTFDNSGVVATLKEQFPEIAAVDVNMPVFSRQARLTLELTKPSFILASNHEAYLIGINGVALMPASDLKAGASLPVVEDEIATSVQPGKAALSKDQAIFIAVVIDQFEKQGIAIDRLSMAASPYDLKVKPRDLPYYVKFNLLEDAKQQVGSYMALKHLLDEKTVMPKEYVDVRLGERVYYR